MSLDERINYASWIIKNYLYKNKDFTLLYPFTTENLNGYMCNYDFKGKSVLTVGSSCDHILNSHMLGAKKIVCFDVNPLTEDYFNLKKAAFLALSYEEFIKFFCFYVLNSYERNKLVFNDDTFYRILPFLNDDSSRFWFNLFDSFNGIRIRRKLFCNDEESLKVISLVNSFMSRDGYYDMKQKIKSLSPTFITCDLRDVSNKIKDNFDFVMLSNIACFIQSMYVNPLVDFRSDVLKIAEFLNDDGIMFLAYLYDMKPNTKVKLSWDLIYHLDKVFDVFKNENISCVSFTGINGLVCNDNRFTDMVLTLKK